mmetsp:Transcript_36852/g.64921  ORF Transcript_36852/g.64921 Transcript_36852/m.64921 type:complete len:472 (+) Transcript_36852:72-1487(+)
MEVARISASSAKVNKESDSKEVKSSWDISFLLLCLVNAIDGADMALLPSSFRALEADLGLRPSMLACMTMCQGVACAASGPFWASIADHGSSRKQLIVSATAAWGLAVCSLALISDFPMMVLIRTINGIALGAISPVIQSLVADQARSEERGYHFGLLGFCKTGLGGVITSFVVTSYANASFYGVSGWRVACGAIGILSLMAGVVVAMFFQEPPRKLSSTRPGVLVEFQKLVGYFREIPTFFVVVAQGAFGCIPFCALHFMTLFFQYLGISDLGAATLTCLNMFGAGVGYFAGGIFGDYFAKLDPDHGRIYVAQASILFALPLVVIIFNGVPHDTSHFHLYASLSMMLGIVCSWCEAGCNRPMLIDVVPSTSRASVFTWVYSIEWTISQLAAAPAISLLSELCYGYTPRQEQVWEMPEAARIANAGALGQSLVLCTALPWVMACLIYQLAHYTFKSDRIEGESESLIGQNH